MAGGSLAVIGAWMPWLSFFAGLQWVSGLSGPSGWTIATLGMIAVAGSVLEHSRGGTLGRWISGLAGFGVLAVGGWAAVGLIDTVNGLAHDPLLVSALEPGLLIAIIGGGLAFAVLFLSVPAVALAPVATAPGRLPSAVAGLNAPALLLAGALAVAGAVHVLLAPGHGRESLVMGTGFLTAGLGQLMLAGLVAFRRRVSVLAATVGLNVVLVGAYIIAVTMGLPVVEHAATGSAAAHGALGHVEPIDGVGVGTVLIELVALGLALRILYGQIAPVARHLRSSQ